MDLNWLSDFECLARTRNFTRASQERNITQSAFSRRIKALESWVGLPLVNRDTYPVQLTEAGKHFLPVAAETVGHLAETRRVMREADRGDRRFVRFSSLHTISSNYLAGRIENMQVTNPELRTRVLSDSLSACCDMLEAGAVDILLCYYHPRVAPQIDAGVFERKDLMRDPLLPVAAAAPARQQGWSLNRQDGPPLPYLAYEPSSFLGMVVEDTVGRRRLNTEVIYVDGLVETIKRRVMNGGGFAWLPETSVAAELAEGRLVRVGDEGWSTGLTISALGDTEAMAPTARSIWDSL